MRLNPHLSRISLLGLTTIGVTVIFLSAARPIRAGAPLEFNPNWLIDDPTFIDFNSLSVEAIQTFLEYRGSGLANFRENNRSAAEIIWGAAHGVGDASNPRDANGNYLPVDGIMINPTTGTVNPRVLLTILQKEQSLITTANPSQVALDYAMGYKCFPSCNPNYKGFTKQVEWAAWQLRYNYERAQGHGFANYQVGQTMTFSNSIWPYNPPPTQAVTLGNRATAALYRYTPHVYNGNYNFWRLYRLWFAEWSAELVSQSPNPIIQVGSSGEFSVQFRNTGTETWQRGIVNLGTDQERDRVSGFLRENRSNANRSGWISPNRVELIENQVAPGEIGTFRFYYTIPIDFAPGSYREYFNLVADGVTWFSSAQVFWDITVTPFDSRYRATWIGQNAYPILPTGGTYQFEVSFRNNGTETWQRGIVNLGTDRWRDRISTFSRAAGWLSDNRIALVEESVPPGGIGTFRFSLTVPGNLAPGIYREYFRPVADGITWLDDWGVYWDIEVFTPKPGYHPDWVGQSAYPTLAPGESTNLEIKFRNTGTETWQRGIVNLGTDQPRDRIPIFIRGSGWISSNRIALVEESVPPGGIGTFRFSLTVPGNLAPGTYREYFRPVADGITWLDNPGIYLDITVRSAAESYRATWIGQNRYPSLRAGQSYEFEVQFKNDGLASWQKGTVNLGTHAPRDRTPVFERGAGWLSDNRIALVEESVPPGGIGTFRFSLTVPGNLAPGTYREYFRPVADGITWMDDWGVYWDITIQ